MDMTPGSKHNDEHDEAQKKVFRGYGFRPGGINYPTKLFSVYRGIYYTAKTMGIAINHEIRISIKQPVFHGKF